MTSECKEALAVHCALRLLGFGPSEIKIECSVDGNIWALLRTQGLTFKCHVGSCLFPEKFRREFRTQATRWNDNKLMTSKERTQIYEASWVYDQREVFVRSIVNKGIVLPVFGN